jgi:D-ornithine 4,5-aminomutase subunit alpha
MRERPDDFTRRRAHLADMSEAELEKRFWELADKLTQPLVDLAYKHTSPSIERSVLLRMGLSSIESQAIVNRAIDAGLIGKGAGHIVYAVAKSKNLDIRLAGQALADGKYWEDAAELFAQPASAARTANDGGAK